MTVDNSAASLQPWDRRESESAQAFAAFVLYRDLGATRSIDEAYRRAKNAPDKHQDRCGAHHTGRADGTWKGWSSTHEWVPRCLAYDTHLDRLVRLAVEGVAVDKRTRIITDAMERIHKEILDPAGDWRAALESLKRLDRAEWGDNAAITMAADKRAGEIIADLLFVEQTESTP
jgi:hypothetical protein